MSDEPFTSNGVRGVLHRPERASGDGLALTHGAGGNCNAPVLVAAAAAFCAAGFIVLRFDMPFRQRRPSGPPSPPGAAEDRAGIRGAALALRALAPKRLIIGGHSYGGRQATMLAAEEPKIADALLLFCYPLHPPAKPDQLRTAHFPRLNTPAVFVHGTMDGFGSLDEMTAALSLIPAPTELLPIARAGHDLKPGRIDFQPVIAAAMRLAG